MNTAKKKDSRFDFRVSSEDRSLIELAAELSGEDGPSSFAIKILRKESQKIINKNQAVPNINLIRDEAIKFLKALDNPPQASKALKSAAKKFKEKHGY